MIEKKDITQTIAKYAILIAVFYALQYGINTLSRIVLPKIFTIKEYTMLYSFIPIGINLLINIILMLIAADDIKKYKIETRYILLATFFSRILGICLLLISMVHSHKANTIDIDELLVDENQN